MDKLTKEARIELALSDLRKQSIPSYTSTAERFLLNRTTLTRRFKGSQQSFQVAREETHQCLTLAQEEALISFINRLIERSLPPTSQIVKNVAEELCNKPIRKNWVGYFTERYKDRLHGCYLRTIDSKRARAEYVPLIQKFYDQVSLYILLYLLYLNHY